MVLIWAGGFSSAPERYLGVVWVAIVTEIVDGIWDIYSVAGGLEEPVIGYATVVIHLIWIFTALWALGRARKELEGEAATGTVAA